MMTSKQTKRVMLLGAGALVVCAAGVVAWGVLSPVAVAVPDLSATPAGARGDEAVQDRSAARGPTLEALKVLAGLDLRQPLIDAPPPAVAPKVLMARLVGTVYDPARPERSMALFKLGDGTDHWLKIGAQFNDAAGQVTVKTIGQDKATVIVDGEERDLIAATP